MYKRQVKDFSTNTVVLIDSGADVNCIKRGIVPTKYCEKTNDGLSSVNGTPLTISYKLNKGYIKNNGYCFKNTFLIVDNMTSDLILGTPFLTQIYMLFTLMKLDYIQRLWVKQSHLIS